MMTKVKLYLVVGAAFAVLSAFGWLAWKNAALSGQLSASQEAEKRITSERDAAIEANRMNTEALRTLAQYRALDNALLLKLQGDFQKWDEKFDKSQKSRDELKRTNPDVKTFLDLPIPDALRLPNQRANRGTN